jgi:hypothetical protein
MRISHDSAGGRRVRRVAEYSRVAGNLFVPCERVSPARGNDPEDQPVGITSARKGIDWESPSINFQIRSNGRERKREKKRESKYY